MELMSFHNNSFTTQCLVCSADSQANYVDLSLITSRTSHSETHVREKLITILNDKWISSETTMSFVMCLPCFHLVDQYDALETQLKTIQDKLCGKYIGCHGVNETPIVLEEKPAVAERSTKARISTGARGRRAPTVPKRQSAVRKRIAAVENTDTNVHRELSHTMQNNGHPKKTKTADSMLHWQQTTDSTFETNIQHFPDMPGSSQQLTTIEQQTISSVPDSASNWKSTGNDTNMCGGIPTAQSQVALPVEAVEEDRNIYDNDPNLVNPGERLRVGCVVTAEANSISYSCGYCTQYFSDIETLKLHVRSLHRPEILTTQIPPHLGLPTKVNCGAQIANVTTINELAKPFVCLFCNGAFKFKSNIQLHYKEKHTPFKPFFCADCDESFRRSMELSRHRVYYCPDRKKARPGTEKKSK